MEYQAFAKTIAQRTTMLADGTPGFELWPELDLAVGTPQSLVREGDTEDTKGKMYLLLKCIRD